MPAKPVKKAPAKKEAPKKEEPPAPIPEPEPEPTPVEAPPAEAPPAEGEAPAEEGAPAEGEAPAEPAPREPTPPPPPEPTSAPVELFVEDKNDTSITIIWSQPETIGDSGLDGYTIEVCKDGTEDWKAVNEELQKSTRYVIKNQTTGDRLKIRVVALNAGGRSVPVALPEAVLVKEVADRPKVRLPRYLKQRYVANVGDKVNITIPFSGTPKPVVTWSKDGQPVDTKKVGIRNSDKDSILFIRQAQRDDSGVYEMCVKVDDFEDKASIILQFVELPGPPASVKVVDTWGFNVSLEWTAPKDTGNTTITGYTIQKADKKTGDWFTVIEHFNKLNTTVADLVMGNTYKFRVFSENKCGKSEDAAVTKESATILKTVTEHKVAEYQEHDFTEVPKFTTPLPDKTATAGYNTRFFCSVRGQPVPKIQWSKNQLLIGDDPKYVQVCIGGIASLEIRKTGNFDGGVYACKATNARGEASIQCKLVVIRPDLPAEKK